MSIKDYCNSYERALVDAVKYVGSTSKHDKIFSASMLGRDPLENYLGIINKSKDNVNFEANTMGSIYQLGVDKVFEDNEIYVSSERLELELDNGWLISGETDQIDTEGKIIFDNKVTTATAIKSTQKEGKRSLYGLQMGVYKYLKFKETGEIYDTVLVMIDKNFSYFKTSKTNQLNFVPIETFSPEEIEAMLIEKTNEMDTYLDMGQEPSRCANRFTMNRGGKITDMKCKHYCGVKDYCSYYNNKHPNKLASDFLGL